MNRQEQIRFKAESMARRNSLIVLRRFLMGSIGRLRRFEQLEAPKAIIDNEKFLMESYAKAVAIKKSREKPL